MRESRQLPGFLFYKKHYFTILFSAKIFTCLWYILQYRDDYTKIPLIVIEKLYVLKKFIKSFETFNSNWSVSETKLI